MATNDPARSSETPLSQDLLYTMRYYLGGRRAWIVLAAVAGLGGLVLNWDWLVVIGVAPLLIAALPCIAMCALGLCMVGRSCKSEQPTHTSSQPEADTRLRAESQSLALVEDTDEPLVQVEYSESTDGGAQLAQVRADDPTVAGRLPETTTKRS